jgi:mannose-6-phosphate isomerase-like protein (cupin superfamily)
MQPKIVKAKTLSEYMTPERCFILENWGLVSAQDPAVSIARVRIETEVTTKAHHLDGAQEIYIITKGRGRVYVGSLEPEDVVEGDVVVIPSGVSQRIGNIGETDLVFYCVCTPAFTEKRYHDGEMEKIP